MGEAKRRASQQQAARRGSSATRAARGRSTDRTSIVIGVVAVAVIAAAVIIGVVVSNHNKNQTAGRDIPVATRTQGAEPSASALTASYPVARDGAAVVVGKDTAKVTVDVYEDFLCPICGRFEATDGDAIQQHLTDGSLKVRYHIVAILNDRSDPPGYSLDAANAALCAADAGKFPGYHLSLYSAQPEEGARGYDRTQLAKLGTDLGITDPSFASCVTSGKYSSALQQAEEQITSTDYLLTDNGQGGKGFGTPTLAVGRRAFNPLADRDWLTNLFPQG